jgi:ubiquinone/menaquinone biosynthesis C-methylase UbiE
MPQVTFEVAVEETNYGAPTEWRRLGAEGKAQHVIALCERFGVSPTKLLEVGAGDGAILRFLGEHGFCKAMHAVEIARSGVDLIREQQIPGLVSCQRFDGYHLPFRDGEFDLVILSHVLEHVEYERALLREIRRVSTYQVIEIPMDFTALDEKGFSMLGPSYGHINAHSPASFRFLLATEGFRVVGDLLGRTSLAAAEYDYFVNNSHARSPEAVQAFRARWNEEERAFAALPLRRRERRSSYYAVLTRAETVQERAARAIEAASAYVETGRIQPARLIFEHFVPDDERVSGSLAVARAALEAGELAPAREFADKALNADPANAVAKEFRNRLEDGPFEARRKSGPSRNSVRRRAKALVKTKFPFVASALRRLRG